MACIEHKHVYRRMIGIKPYLDQVDALLADVGDSLDGVIDEAIAGATARFERELEMCIERTVIKQAPDDDEVEGTDYDLRMPPMDWERTRFDKLTHIQLRKRPVISVESIKLQLHDEIALIEFPAEWWEDHIQYRLGRVNLVPVALGDMALSATGHPIYKWVTGLLPWPVLPQCLMVNYTAGWPNAATDERLADFRRLLSCDAALRVLRDVRDLVPSSVSLDGASESFDTLMQRLQERQEEIDAFFVEWRQENNPQGMVVV